MNKLYTSAAALMLVVSAASAQSGANAHPVKKERAFPAPAQATHPASSDLRGSSIWSNDFSDPSSWVIAHDGNFNLDWQIGVGLASQGDYPTPAIASTTAANGYGMVDSDFGHNLTTDYEKAHITTAAPIDLSAFPNVILEFQNQYRRFTDEQTYVIISTNNTDWPDIDPLSDISAMPNVFYVFAPGELTTSVSPGNPTTKRINISAVAGGQSQVWVRFLFTGIWGYTWYVDDVKIIEQAQFDMAMLNGFLSHTGLGEEFGRIPANQLNPTMKVGGDYLNFGVQEETNVTVNAEVRDASNVLAFNASSTPATVAPGEQLTMDQDVTLPVLANGLYTGTFSVTSDQIADDGFPDNNTYLRTFEVTQDIYSLDGIGNHPPGNESLTSTGTNSFTDNTDNVFLFTYYPIITPMNVAAIEVRLANGTVPGGQVYVSLHDTADVLADDPNSPLIVSNEYTVTQADVDNGRFVIVFDAPYTLQPGGYYAGVQLNSNTNANDMRVLDDITVPQPTLSSVIWLQNDANNPNTTFTNGNAFAIRLSADATIGINEHAELQGITVYPNPSTGLVNVNANVAGSHNLEVMNALGEVVATDRFNLNTNLDLSGLAKGVYSVRISTPEASTVQRITLN